MATDLLETTRQADLQPLMAPSGIAVYKNFASLRAELKRSLSEEHVGLFAQPNADPATGDIQWYAPVSGVARRLNELDAKTRASVESRLAPLIKDISTHADQLLQSGSEQVRLMGGNLAQALEIPDESHIFVIGDQPVVAAWGHVPRGPATPIRLLVALAQRALEPTPPPAVESAQPPSQDTAPPPPAARPQPATQAQVQQAPADDGGPARYRLLVSPNTFRSVPAIATGIAWLSALLWALFTLLLLIIGYLLLKYCAIGLPGSANDIRTAIFNFCDLPAVAANLPANTDYSRQASLLAKLNQLELSIEAKRRACHAQTRPDASRPTTTPEASSRLQREHGQVGAVNLILTWNTDDDLDLHVRCPDGTQIFFANQRACGAVLDVDQNMADNSVTREPVENIFWADTNAVPGEYTVWVDRYKSRSSGDQATNFRVELRINNQQVESHDGRIDGEKTLQQVFTFKIPYERH